MVALHSYRVAAKPSATSLFTTNTLRQGSRPSSFQVNRKSRYYRKELILLTKRVRKLEKQHNCEYTISQNSKLSLKQLKKRVEVLESKVKSLNQRSELCTRTCLKFLLPEAKHWHNIGTLLGISESNLEQIEADYPGRCQDCVREMIKVWLKQVEPRPTWKDLADAVEVINPMLSKKILRVTTCTLND